MRILLAISLLSFFVYAQEQPKDNTGVELPQFVITGQDLINLQQTKKPSPDLVPVISDDFLKPEIAPDQLDLPDPGAPENPNSELRDSSGYLTGRIKAMIGAYTLPLIDATASLPFQNGLAGGYLYEENTRSYISNSGRNYFNGGANLSLFSDYQSSFLPGTEYRFYGNYNSLNHRFYGGDQPQFKRIISRGLIGASLQNTYSDILSFGAALDYKPLTLTKEEFSDNVFSVSSFGKLYANKLSAGYKLNYRNENFSDSLLSGGSYNFFAVRPYAAFDIGTIMKASFGVSYSVSGNSNFLAPYGAFAFRLSRQLSFYGEYSPDADFITPSELLDKNIYYNPQGVHGLYVKKAHDLKAAFKFEYERYFEFNGGLKYISYDNLPYFLKITTDGRFSLSSVDAYTYGAFLNLLFHNGPFGYLYATVEASDTKDEENNYIPYFPSLNSSLTYGYNFPAGLNFEANLVYRSGVYKDLPNSSKIRDYINLNLGASYNLNNNLRLTAALNNVLDRENYFWENYREIPLNFMGGISFTW